MDPIQSQRIPISSHSIYFIGHKRYKDQDLLQILEACAGGGASKTQIVYKSGLNFHTILPYLELLSRNGLTMSSEKSKSAETHEGTGRVDRAGEYAQ